jgi:Fur family transcriptional regulator, ferric uptake regulator
MKDFATVANGVLLGLDDINERVARGHPGLTMAQSTHKSEPPNVKELQAFLRTAGLRSTSARIAVLEYFHTHSGPNSHAELFTAIAEKGFDRATVYRVLMDFSESGILSRTDLGDHVWRFELKKGVGGLAHTEEHPHFVCVDCGEVSCLPGLSFKLEGRSKAPKSVSKKQVAVQISGRCDKCT